MLHALHTLLTWHLTATALLLVAYGVVVGLQWSRGQVRRLVADLERRRATRPAREREATPRHAVRSAA